MVTLNSPNTLLILGGAEVMFRNFSKVSLLVKLLKNVVVLNIFDLAVSVTKEEVDQPNRLFNSITNICTASLNELM